MERDWANWKGYTTPTQEEINQALYAGQGRKSKYNVDHSAKGKEERTLDGRVFDSKRELEVYRDYVKPNVNIGVFRDLRFQVPFDLNVAAPGGFKVKIGSYRADFCMFDRAGKLVVIEAKGHETPLWKRTRKHFEVEYGLRIMTL